jgi:hypothetical protein
MGKKSRAERRHHHKRMIDRVKEFFWLKPKHYHGSEEERQKHIRKMAETRHPCSCHMCGNPRKNWNEMTLQEQKAYIKEKFDNECG